MKAKPRIHYEQVYQTVKGIAQPQVTPVNVPQDRNEDHPVADFPVATPWSANPNSTASTGGGGVLGQTAEPPASA